MDASNAPVLRWQPVQRARTVSSRASPRVRGASVVPAASGGSAMSSRDHS